MNVQERHCEAPGCGQELPARRRRFCSDLCRIRGQRAERVVDGSEFAQAAIRMVRALAKRAGASDIDTFELLWELQADVGAAIAIAVDDLRAKDFSDTDIGMAMGYDKEFARQEVHRRFGSRIQADDRRQNSYTDSDEEKSTA